MKQALSNSVAALWAAHLQPYWQRLSVREQHLLRLLASLLLLALAVSLLVLPAWHTWQHGTDESAALSQQLGQMRALQTQARQLQQQRPSAPANAVPLLQKLASANGWTAQAQGGRVLVQVKAANPTALAQWLAQAREQAQALPTEAHLQRSAGNEARWDGSLLLRLPDTPTSSGPAQALPTEAPLQRSAGSEPRPDGSGLPRRPDTPPPPRP